MQEPTHPHAVAVQSRRPTKRWVLSTVAVLAILSVVVGVVLIRRPPPEVDSKALPGANSPTPHPSASASASNSPSETITQLSGVSGDGAVDGSFGTWRGTPVTIGGTWDDTVAASETMHTSAPGAEWGAWQGALDVAVGALDESAGESWAQAAVGAYDARWQATLETIRTDWAGRRGQLYIRFAHEFNARGVPWRVTGADAADFVQAWRRFRVLQLQIMPSAKLVFCTNDVTNVANKLDWRTAFPGSDYVDVMSVDSYNQSPWVNSAAAFATKINSVDSYGAPIGIEKHRQFAEQVGLPMAVSEWGSNSLAGDAPVYMTSMKNWFRTHAGRGPGDVPYEIYFNVNNFGDAQYALFPKTRMPLAAAAYIAAF